MELYHKKVNLGTKQPSGPEERYDEMRYNPSRRPNNIYFQKMMKQNQSKLNNEPIDISYEDKNIPSIHSNLQNILSDENNKKKALKFMALKNRNFQSPKSKQKEKRLEKSFSPRGRGGRNRDYEEDSREATPIRKVLNLSREPYYSAIGKKFNTINNDNPRTKNNLRNLNRKNYKDQYNQEEDDEDYYNNQKSYYNPEENPNDLEFSSIKGDERYPRGKISKSPEPIKLRNNFSRVIRKPNYRGSRNKDIQIMPRLKKQSNTNYLGNNMNREEDDVDKLIRTIEDLQDIIDGQENKIRNITKDNLNKEKEINLLRNDLDDLQKELDDKRTEHDKEIDDIFRSNDNNQRLKNEYYKLLQDYDNSVNDFNNLKDDYNKMIDEYNILKDEKNKLSEDNKNLKESNKQLK
jgi:hypothetical protein